MSTAGPDVVTLTQSRSVLVAVVVGLAIAVVACFLCALLMLYVKRQANGRNSSRRPKSLLPMLEKNYYHASTLSASSFGCTQAKRAATFTAPVHSHWHAQPTTTNHKAAHGTQGGRQSAEVPAIAQIPKLQGYNPLSTTIALPIDSRNSFSLKSASARRLGLDLERAWPERDGSQEQLLWRNSSGGSSCYSRPSSWYSVSNTGGLGKADLSCELGAGPGPTLHAQRTTAYRYKALPPVPVQKEQSNIENVAVVNRI